MVSYITFWEYSLSVCTFDRQWILENNWGLRESMGECFKCEEQKDTRKKLRGGEIRGKRKKSGKYWIFSVKSCEADCHQKIFTLMDFPEFCTDMSESIFEPGWSFMKPKFWNK